MVNASLKNYRQSPRKVRLVVDAIRGKGVTEALNILTFTVKRSSDPVKKLLNSAIANAKHNHGLDEENLFVKEIRVDEGITMKRYRARARGSAAPIRKRTSHVNIVLAEKETGKTVVSEESKEESPKKEVKKTVAKKSPAKKTETKKVTKTKK
jgi:large subunit ribosomal protein L22